MILANKIIALRKKAGWSQEDLADQLGVSRQSVSKWEGAQSIPNMDKIVQMSRIFGVSTDYLLKDELCDEDPIVSVSEEGRDVRRVSMEEASNYLSLRRRMAPRMAIATFLCVLSPVLLMMLAALSEVPDSGVSENLASAIGLCTMFGLVAVSVGLFISCGSKTREFSFLDGVGFETEYGVEGMLRDRMRTFAPTYTRLCIAGTILCIVSVIPIFVASGLEVDDFLMVLSVCFMFILVGIGCVCFVYGNTIENSMKRLLEEGDFSRESKSASRVTSAVSTVYWLVVTAIFLAYSFWPATDAVAKTRFKESWLVWPIAGVLYAAVMTIVSLVRKDDKG